MCPSEFERIMSLMCGTSTNEEPAPPEKESVVSEADRLRAIDLAGIIMQARWRVMLSSLSKEECKRLELLQEKFDALEREFNSRFPEGTLAEVLTGYDPSKLRSFIPPAEPARKEDFLWGYVPVSQTPPAPRPQVKQRPYGVGTTGNND